MSTSGRERMKLITVVGARPQFIKAAAVSRAIAQHNLNHCRHRIEETIVHTGQHYDENMSQVFFDQLEIPRPDYNLEVSGGLHGQQTGRMLERIEKVILEEKPDRVLVYGDTNSTLAGTLAAAKLHIPVAHVEAGLRSFNRIMPEEINRVLTDHVADMLFCPTPTAVENLSREGITEGVYETGDVMYDCALFYRQKAQQIESEVIKRMGVQRNCFYLATIHRAENTDNPERLHNIFTGLAEISTPENPTVLPLHPRTKKYIENAVINPSENIKIISPVSYLEMVALESNAQLILTDSGGVQKEAYMFQTPCVTLREETEWIETVQAGWNRLVGADPAKIISAAQSMVGNTPDDSTKFYGDGNAAEKICKIFFNNHN